MKITLLTTLFTCAALAACSSSDIAIGSRADAGPDDASPSSPNDAAAPSPDAGAAPSPTAFLQGANLELDVVPVNPGTKPLPGLLVVVWSQLDDDGPDPLPLVAYSVPFTGNETHVTIPLSAVAAPTEPLLLCQRACTDEAVCPCQSDPKVGFGYIVVVHDANGNGVADLTASKATSEKALGIARSILAWSAQAYSHPAPGLFDSLFPDGVRAGAHLYDLVRPDGGSFDRLGFPPPGATFQLPVCDSLDVTVCKPKAPNLT